MYSTPSWTSTAPRARDGPALFRALAVKAAYPTDAVHAADPPGQIAAYDADRLATLCVRTGRPILISPTPTATT